MGRGGQLHDKRFVNHLHTGVDQLSIGTPAIPSAGVHGKKSLMIPPFRNSACKVVRGSDIVTTLSSA